MHKVARNKHVTQRVSRYMLASKVYCIYWRLIDNRIFVVVVVCSGSGLTVPLFFFVHYPYFVCLCTLICEHERERESGCQWCPESGTRAGRLSSLR